MRFSDLTRCAARELFRRRARSAALAAGFALAAAGVVGFSGVWQASRQDSDKILAGTGTHFITFRPAAAQDCIVAAHCPPGQMNCPPQGAHPFWFNGTPTQLLPPDLVAKVSTLSSVRDVSPCLLMRLTHRSGNPYLVAGLDASNATAVRTTSCAATDILSGEFLKPGESHQAVLEESYAKSQNLTTGSGIEIAGQPFRVIGVANTGARPAKADVYVTLQDARNIAYAGMYNPPADMTNLLLVEAKDATSHERAMSEVKAALAGSTITSYNCYLPAAQVMGINQQTGKLLLAAAGLAAFLVALKSQWAGLIERRREIAILKVLGWTPGMLARLIFLEALLLALAGSVLGCVLGQAILSFTPVHGAAAGLSAWAMAIPLVVAGALLAAVLPVWHAARQWPANGLRMQ